LTKAGAGFSGLARSIFCADALWYQAHPDAEIEELELVKE
jgi:hypothetical protein